jgi:hypothetical protein
VHDGATRLADKTQAWTIAVAGTDSYWHGWGLLRAAGWLRVGWLCAGCLRVGENLRLWVGRVRASGNLRVSLPVLLLGLWLGPGAEEH